MKYDKQYFIDKFEAIPADKFLWGAFSDERQPGCYCVLGHCGLLPVKKSYSTVESDALIALFGGDEETVEEINNGEKPKDVLSDSRFRTIDLGIKGRILTALRALP